LPNDTFKPQDVKELAAADGESAGGNASRDGSGKAAHEAKE
jgi:hypothetical protein